MNEPRLTISQWREYESLRSQCDDEIAAAHRRIFFGANTVGHLFGEEVTADQQAKYAEFEEAKAQIAAHYQEKVDALLESCRD